MQIEKLNLSHKALINESFSRIETDIAEYTFANLYLFREIHRYEVFIAKKIYIKGVTRDHFNFLMPLFNPESYDWDEVHLLLQDYDCLFPISEEWLNRFDPKIYQSTFIDSESDYLFSAEKISTYPGRHLDGKRNLVSQFKRNDEIEVYSLTSEHKKNAFRILEIWKEEQQGDLCKSDYYPCRESLDLLQELALIGRIYYVQQEPVGFVLGELLKKEVFSIHFAKASRQYKGSYQYIFQELAQSLSKNVLFLNFEQDLGIPELRKSKRSYFPDKLVKKFRVFLRH